MSQVGRMRGPLTTNKTLRSLGVQVAGARMRSSQSPPRRPTSCATALVPKPAIH